MSERNSAVGLEYEISNFDWVKDILYKTFQDRIVFIKNNPWVKIMSTNILDKNITTSAKELPQSFGDMTYITLRNPKKKHTIQIHEHRDPNDHNDQIKLCKRYQNKPLLDIGTAGCLIPIEEGQMDSSERAQKPVVLTSEILQNLGMIQDKVLIIGKKIFAPIRSHHNDIEFSEIERIEKFNQKINPMDKS